MVNCHISLWMICNPAYISVGEMKEDAMDFCGLEGAKEGEPYWEAPWVRDVPAGTLNVLQWHAVIWENSLMFTVVVKI